MTAATPGPLTDEDLAALRTQLEGLTGEARIRTLLELGRQLADQYWRAGPGTGAGLPILDEAVTLFEEAYGYPALTEPLRSQVGGQLGWLIGTRHLAHGGSDVDRDRSIHLIEESLPPGTIPQASRTVVRLMLGQLLLSRAAQALRGGTPAFLTSSAGRIGDVEQAAECFREVLDTSTDTAAVDAATSMLRMARALRTLLASFGSGTSGFDVNAVLQFMEAMRSIQEEIKPQLADRLQFGTMPPPLAVQEEAAGLRVVDRDEGASPRSADGIPSSRRAPASAEEIRTAFGGRAGDSDPFTALARLLGPPMRVPAVDVVDDLIALASMLIESDGTTPADQLILAAALFLRSCIDSGGWTMDDDGVHDRDGATTALLAGATALPDAGTVAVVVALRLAALLDAKDPSGRLSEKVTLAVLKHADV